MESLIECTSRLYCRRLADDLIISCDIEEETAFKKLTNYTLCIGSSSLRTGTDKYYYLGYTSSNFKHKKPQEGF